MTVTEALAENERIFMEQGPKLSTRYSVVVLGRDRARDRVLLGGLGACGVGQMWVDASEYDAKRIGWAEAPDVKEYPALVYDIQSARAEAAALKNRRRR